MANIKVTEEKIRDRIMKSVNIQRLAEMVFHISKLVVSKNHDYGDAWQRYGIFTPLIRINDKILRVQTLMSGERALVADETVKDTLEDIIGYAALALQWIEENEANEKTWTESLRDLLYDTKSYREQIESIPVDERDRMLQGDWSQVEVDTDERQTDRGNDEGREGTADSMADTSRERRIRTRGCCGKRSTGYKPQRKQ